MEIEDFSNWEENIKDSLCNLIRSPNINNEFNNECFKQDSSEIYGLIDKIKKIRDKLKENEKEKNESDVVEKIKYIMNVFQNF